MRIIFAGTPEFSVCTLQALIKAGHDVVCVYTQPDRKTGRGQKLTPPAVKQCAVKHSIPVRQPLSLKGEVEQQELKELEADVMIVVAYGLLLPQAVLDAPKFGCLNIHASLLPKWRGAAPIQRSIQNGDDKTGVCIMQMDIGLDTGDVLLRAETPILANDTSASLHDKLADIGAEALITCLADLEDYQSKALVQDHENATYAHKITKAEANIDWQQSALEIDQQIRAFKPWPISQTYLIEKTEDQNETESTRYRIWKSEPLDEPHTHNAGEIIRTDKSGIYVACGEGVIKLETLQRDGSKAMQASDLINGNKLALGMSFSSQTL